MCRKRSYNMPSSSSRNKAGAANYDDLDDSSDEEESLVLHETVSLRG